MDLGTGAAMPSRKVRSARAGACILVGKLQNVQALAVKLDLGPFRLLLALS